MRVHMVVSVCAVLLFFLGGCVYMNVSLIPAERPLKEVLLEGEGRDKILLVDVSGFISGRETSEKVLEKKRPMTSLIKEQLEKAEKDRDIKGLILRVDTPGGTVTASDIIYHELVEFKKRTKMPVYTNITGLGTSGGYYVASASEKIFAHPTAITGSIGVIATKIKVYGLMEKIGLDTVSVKSGDKKDIFSSFRPDTPAEEALMQKIIDILFMRFVDVVAEGRRGILDRQEILALSDGQPYTAEQALKANLIDEIGYMQDTIAALKTSIGLEEARVVTYVRPGTYKSSIYSAAGLGSGGDINLINIDSDALAALSGVEFLYLWNP